MTVVRAHRWATEISLETSRAPRLVVNVVGTSEQETSAALAAASSLARDLDAGVRILLFRIVPYPLDVDQPDVAPSFTMARWTALMRNLPMDARFAAYPTYNHPLLLQGRKTVLGYPGHLWTQGFNNYHAVEEKLNSLMRGQGNWKQTAHELGVRYIFWGREENTNYPTSSRPWARLLPKAASGDWGTIYDLGDDKTLKR